MTEPWQWVIQTVAGENLAELTSARDLSVTWRLDGPGEARFTVDDQDLAATVIETRTDLMILHDGAPLWRGRIAPSSDLIDSSAHTSSFTALDYRGMLARRFTANAQTYTATDTATAAWMLVDYTQHNGFLPPGGPLGITKGWIPTVITRDLTVPSGKPIAEAIDDLGDMYPGFDWWVDADLVFHVDTFRGTQRDFALTFGETVVAVDRQFDPATYANVVHQTGKDGLVAAIRWAPDLGTSARPEGRWETQEGNPDLWSQAVVDDTAERLLERRAALVPSYKMTMTPGVWDPDQAWVGDIVPLRVRSGRLDVDDLERVTEITVTDTGDGTPTIDLTVGELRRDLAAMLRQVPVRLTQLARR